KIAYKFYHLHSPYPSKTHLTHLPKPYLDQENRADLIIESPQNQVFAEPLQYRPYNIMSATYLMLAKTDQLKCPFRLRVSDRGKSLSFLLSLRLYRRLFL